MSSPFVPPHCTLSNFGRSENKLVLSGMGSSEQYALNDGTSTLVFYGACEWEWTCAAGHSCSTAQPGSMVSVSPHALIALHKLHQCARGSRSAKSGLGGEFCGSLGGRAGQPETMNDGPPTTRLAPLSPDAGTLHLARPKWVLSCLAIPRPDGVSSWKVPSQWGKWQRALPGLPTWQLLPLASQQ